MPSIFTKIINGEIPCHKVAEDDKHLAFLDIFPLKKGHTLVIPKQETDYIFDLNDKAVGDLMVFAKKVAKAIDASMPCKRVGVAVIGLEVPHAHIHLVPLDSIQDIDFSQPKLEFSSDELASIAKAIAAKV